MALAHSLGSFIHDLPAIGIELEREAQRKRQAALDALRSVPGTVRGWQEDFVSGLAGRPDLAQEFAGPLLNQIQTEGISRSDEPAGPPLNEIQTAGVGGEVPRSSIRFQLPGGEWKDYQPGGASREARLGMTPEGPPAPPDGGPAVSFTKMEDIPLGQRPPSYFDDLQDQVAESRLKAQIADPFAEQNSRLAAELGLYQGKAAIDLQKERAREQMVEQRLAPFAAKKKAIEDEFRALQQRPEYQGAPQEKRARVDADYAARLDAAEKELLGQMQQFSLGSSHPLSSLFRQGV